MRDTRTKAIAIAPSLGVRAAATSRAGLWDDIARVGLVSAVLLVILTFRSYGIIWDEEWQSVYGHKILAWYQSFFTDTSALTYANLYFYGGAFDFAAALISKISPLGEYETRHLMGGLIGVLGLAGAWSLGRRLGGARAGVLGGALLIAIPGFWGHAFFNPKDVPFAVGMLWSLVFAVRIIDGMPHPRLRTVLAFGVIWGLTLGSRIGAILMVPYLGLAVLALVALEWHRHDWRRAATLAGRATLAIAPALPVAYVTMGIVWPWAVQSPLNPLVALTTFSHFNWAGDVLTFGRHLTATTLPFWYLPGQLAVQLPEIVLAGLLAACGLGMNALARGQWRRPDTNERLRRGIPLALVILAAIFPIAYFMAMVPPAYHGYRHFIFVVPPLAVLSALGLDRVLALLERRGAIAGKVAGAAIALALATQAVTMARLFPDEYIYYNQLAGGVAGANGEFNLEYWGNSLREAAGQLNAYMGGHRGPGGRPWRVDICGYSLSAAYYLGPNFIPTDQINKADFYVSFTESRCDSAEDGRVVGVVQRMGVPLAIVKDRRALVRTDPVGRLGDEGYPNPDR